VNIIWLSVKEGTPARGYWDQRLLEELFEKEQHFVMEEENVRLMPMMKDEAGRWVSMNDPIVVIPGAYQFDCIDKINKFIARFEKCTVIITSDEENNFPIDELSHENMRVFADYYNPKYTSDITWLPIGPANIFNISPQGKTRDFFFMGQVTHPKRQLYVDQIKSRADGFMLWTDGFARGDTPEDYYKGLATAKVAPSPAGNISPDAFRTYEAICAGAVPIPTDTEWHRAVFGDVPFPVIDDYEQINGYMDMAISQYPVLNNRVQEWWIQYKRKMKNILIPPKEKGVTVIIPVSPIKSHPSTEIIDETIRNIRAHLPDSEIIVTFDGVRSEQEDRREDYDKFKRFFLWDCLNNPDYKNIFVLDFEEHSHQVKMAREALKYVTTDLVLYCEQDTPLTPDEPIDWQKCEDFIRSGEANMIRFHFEAFVPEPHLHMMIGEVEDGFLRTSQWSQRPHLISKAYFERIVNDYFTEDAVCFIEDKMHGIVSEAYIVNGLAGWYQHRLWVYHPEGNIKRSYHTDGRAGEAKWDDTQIW
jgi:hypothetical protein